VDEIQQRRYHIALQVFKSLHQISPPYLHNIFNFLRIRQVILVVMFFVFLSPEFSLTLVREVFYWGAVLWNSLPLSVSEAATVPSFKNSYLNSFWFCFCTCVCFVLYCILLLLLYCILVVRCILCSYSYSLYMCHSLILFFVCCVSRAPLKISLTLSGPPGKILQLQLQTR